MRRFAKRRPERADEVGLRHAGDLCQTRDAQRLREGAIHRVPGPQHGAVALLDRQAHPETL